MNTNTNLESTVTGVASVGGMGGGSATSIFGFLVSNESLIVAGLVTTVLGFVINLIFQIRRDRRESELHAARLTEALSKRVEE